MESRKLKSLNLLKEIFEMMTQKEIILWLEVYNEVISNLELKFKRYDKQKMIYTLMNIIQNCIINNREELKILIETIGQCIVDCNYNNCKKKYTIKADTISEKLDKIIRKNNFDTSDFNY